MKPVTENTHQERINNLPKRRFRLCGVVIGNFCCRKQNNGMCVPHRPQKAQRRREVVCALARCTSLPVRRQIGLVKGPLYNTLNAVYQTGVGCKHVARNEYLATLYWQAAGTRRGTRYDQTTMVRPNPFIETHTTKPYMRVESQNSGRRTGNDYKTRRKSWLQGKLANDTCFSGV